MEAFNFSNCIIFNVCNYCLLLIFVALCTVAMTIWMVLWQGSLEYGVDEDDEEGGPGEHWTPRRRDHELQQPGTDSAAYGLPTPNVYRYIWYGIILFNIVSCELSNSLGLQFSGLDILALLVSIYGSSDLFIVEYRSLLAEKLLANLKYLTEQEVANLELLKIRSNSTFFSLLKYINVCMYVCIQVWWRVLA